MDTKLSLAQNQYKPNHYKHVKKTLVFTPEQLEYVEKLAFTASSLRDADKRTTTTTDKLLPKTIEPLKSLRLDAIHQSSTKTAHATRYLSIEIH